MGPKAQWVHRFDDTIWSKPVSPGVWRRKQGGYHVRARVKNPKTGRLSEVNRILADATAEGARAELARALEEIRNPAGPPAAAVRLRQFAASWLKRRIEIDRELKSASTREAWASVLDAHVLPQLGDHFIDKIDRTDIETFKKYLAGRIDAGKLKATTANNILTHLKVLIRAVVEENDLPNDPTSRVKQFPGGTLRKYHPREPNSLDADELSRFLDEYRRSYPKTYAAAVLMFSTGLRPSSVRPLRRQGPNSDMNWSKGVLFIGRSHSSGDEVMDSTKTGKDISLPLPPSLVDLLRWHTETQFRTDAQKKSDYLFPARDGGLLSNNCFGCFGAVAKKIGLAKRITPRAARRTFQDLCRAGAVHDAVTRSISGHASAKMQVHYSTAQQVERRDAIDRVIHLAAPKGLLPPPSGAPGGGKSTDDAPAKPLTPS